MVTHRSPDAPATPGGCPCGSGVAYDDCCGRWHHGRLHLQAPDPLSLMRSRYAAYVLDDRDYLIQTWHPNTRPAGIEAPDPALRWLGMTIRRHQCEGEHGIVEFVARNKIAGRAHRLAETSRFVRLAGQWFYLDGQFDQ